MIPRLLRAPLALLTVLLVLAAPLRADPPRGFDRLWDALGLSPLVEVMQAEGLAQSDALGFDYLPYPPGAGWAAVGTRASARISTLCSLPGLCRCWTRGRICPGLA